MCPSLRWSSNVAGFFVGLFCGVNPRKVWPRKRLRKIRRAVVCKLASKLAFRGGGFYACVWCLCLCFYLSLSLSLCPFGFRTQVCVCECADGGRHGHWSLSGCNVSYLKKKKVGSASIQAGDLCLPKLFFRQGFLSWKKIEFFIIVCTFVCTFICMHLHVYTCKHVKAHTCAFFLWQHVSTHFMARKYSMT